MEYNYVLLAEILRKMRLFMGFSKRSLAEEVGISHTELTRIENGSRENYNLLTLIKMCKALRIDFVELLKITGYLPLNKGEVDEQLIKYRDEYLKDFKSMKDLKESINKERKEHESIMIKICGRSYDDMLTPNFDDLL